MQRSIKSVLSKIKSCSVIDLYINFPTTGTVDLDFSLSAFLKFLKFLSVVFNSSTDSIEPGCRRHHGLSDRMLMSGWKHWKDILLPRTGLSDLTQSRNKILNVLQYLACGNTFNISLNLRRSWSNVISVKTQKLRKYSVANFNSREAFFYQGNWWTRYQGKRLSSKLWISK